MSVFEVVGGNDRRSMIKRYERKSKQEAIRELIDIIHCNWNQVEQLEAACTQLRGLTPEPPPRPPEGEGLPRFGLRWNGPGQPLSVPMDDGYWTPWHLAEAALIAANQQPSAPMSAANDHDLSHWAESLKCTWPVEPLDPEGAWMIGSIDDHGDGDSTHWPVVTVEADQYDAPGDSEKIAKALSALWQQVFSGQRGEA